MLKWLLAIAVVIVCSGQGCSPDSRLGVTQTLRNACEATGMNDQDIQTTLSGVELDRLNGVTKTEEVRVIQNGCGYDWSCAQCFIAIVDQVYGN